MRNPILPSGVRRVNPSLLSSHNAYTYPAIILLAFTVFTAYMAFPVVDLPLLGLSLSAPVFYLIALEVSFRPPEAWLLRYRRWVRWGALIWIGILLSAVGSGLWSGGENFGYSSLINLARYAYWLLVFVVTCYFVSRLRLGQRTVGVLAGGILALALLRWFEAIILGNIGLQQMPTFMTQNAYGFQFSIFTPMAFVWLVSGRRRAWGLAALLVIWGAVAFNASRSSWIAAALGFLIFLWMYLRSRQGSSRGLLAVLSLVALFGLAAAFSPQRIISPINARFATLQKLEDDKSYATRQLMIQKGWRLVEENPLFGVGIGRFRESSVPLDLPQALRSVKNRDFNKFSSHNSYIQWLAETGLVGTIAYAAFLLFMALVGYRSAMKLARQGQTWAIGAYTAFVCMSIHLWSLSGVTNTSVWFIYGLLGAVIVLAAERQEIDKVPETQNHELMTW